ncbi:MAG TPA: hypothetical protein VMU77_06890, partial [Acidimicrobiales bacterium]|nr:hypothetical protein [Acidimicrobiales bacterium]
YNFAARRFVATSDLKKLRDPDPSEITGNPERGSYLAMYWILKGYGHIWGKWAGQQVMALHKAGRMFEERDHVHTVLYDYKWSLGRDPNGVPVELALDHPYNGLVAEFIDRSEGIDQSDFDRYLANDHLPNILAGSSAGLVAACSPQPMKSGAPGVESKQANTDRTLLLWFLDLNPSSMTDALASHRTRLEADGMGTVKAILPFMPTIPGTDTYTDQLWG